MKTLKWILAAITVLLGIGLCRDLAAQHLTNPPNTWATAYCYYAAGNYYLPVAAQGGASFSQPNPPPASLIFGNYAAGPNYQPLQCDSSGNLIISGAGGVTSFNTRTGAVALSAADVNGVGAITNSTTGNAATATALVSPLTLTPEQYFATRSGGFYYDGTMGGVASVAQSTANTTPTAPATATYLANSLVISAFVPVNYNFSVLPSGNSRIDYTTGGGYRLNVLDQSITTAGSVAANSGTTTASTEWLAGSIVLNPSGGEPTFISESLNGGSGTSLVVTAPAGIVAGDVLISCTGYYRYTLSLPSGFTLLFTASDGASHDQMSCAYKVATGSEPSTYTYGLSTSGSLATGILVYSNAAVLAPNVLYSATANFPSNAAGDVICVGDTSSSGTGQKCGTISTYNSANSATLSFSAATLGSSLSFVYGASDDTAFQNMFNACATAGCKVQLSPGIYMVTQPFVFPSFVSVQMAGAGFYATIPTFPRTQFTPYLFKSMGSVIDWATTALTGPAIAINGSSTLTSDNVMDSVERLALWGGAGYGYDGAGGDCIDSLSWGQLLLNGISCENFKGWGWYSDGLNSSGYTIQQVMQNSQLLYNGSGGIKIGGAAGVSDLETTSITSNVINVNGGPGLLIAGTAIQGLVFQGNTVQWNNDLTNTYTSEIASVSGATCGGCVFSGNYFEVDNADIPNYSTAWINNSVTWIGATLTPNFILPASKNTIVSFEASGGTALPACSATNLYLINATAKVSDSAVCTNGTTYVSGGSTNCVLRCTSGGAWVETGAGW